MICVSSKCYVPKQKSTIIMYRSYKHFDDNKFNDDLSVAPFHVSEIFDDVDDALWLWNTIEVYRGKADYQHWSLGALVIL